MEAATHNVCINAGCARQRRLCVAMQDVYAAAVSYQHSQSRVELLGSSTCRCTACIGEVHCKPVCGYASIDQMAFGRSPLCRNTYAFRGFADIFHTHDLQHMRPLQGQTVSMVDVLWQVRLAKLQAQSTHIGDHRVTDDNLGSHVCLSCQVCQFTDTSSCTGSLLDTFL